MSRTRTRGSSDRPTASGLWCVLALATVLAPTVARADVLRGVVRDGSSRPVFDADFDVFTVDGVLLPMDDNTDADGTYEIVLPPGRYDVICEPPAALALAPAIMHGVLVTGERSIDWQLAPGVRVLGRVLGPNGSVANADLDFDRLDDGSRQPSLGDVTNLFGAFAATVAAGEYRLSIFPTVSSGLAPERIERVSVPGPDTLDVRLVLATELRGRIRGPGGQPVPAARLSFESTSSGARVPVLGNRTDSNGDYSARIRPDTYMMRVAPPPSTRLVARWVGPLALQLDDRRDVDLDSGVALFGDVLDRFGRPVARAEWEVIDHDTREVIALYSDESDYEGRYAIVVPPGRYDLTLRPPPGSGLEIRRFTDIEVVSDRQLDVTYGDVPVPGSGASIRPAINPSHAGGDIILSLPASGPARVELFDVHGRRLRVLHDAWLAAGTHRMNWDGRNAKGARVGAGVYFVRASSAGDRATSRWVVLP